jgi:carboxylesterase type B
VDKLRFRAPEYPPRKKDPPPGPYPVCFQIDDSKCLAAKPFDEDADCFPSYFGNQTEDCLFLDVYVPTEAFSAQNPIRDLPVVVWIYGGAYMFGSKNQYDLARLPFYSGDGLIKSATKNNEGRRSIIYVTG